MRYFSDVAADRYGNAQSGVSITVKLNGVNATIYSDSAGNTTTNPVTSDSSGVISFYYRQSGVYTFWDAGVQVGSVDLHAGPVNVQWFGAKGDGTTDDRAAIQSAIDTGESVYFPKPTSFYKVGSSLTVATAFQELFGDGQLTIIKNTGAGAAVTVTSAYNAFRNLAIWGNGGAGGAGATGTYGVCFNGGTNWRFENCNIRYHGSHGIYCEGGVWVCSFIGSEASQCGGDGISAQTTATANGNALTVVGSSLIYNSGNGLNWNAAALNVSGSTIEGNTLAGVRVDLSGHYSSAFGINIHGNYFEQNLKGQILITTDSGSYICQGGSIAGNYIHCTATGVSDAVSLIVFVGPADSHSNIHVGKNSYALAGNVVNAVDGGSSLRQDCTIDTAYTTGGNRPFINLGNAATVGGSRSIVIGSGELISGVTWGTPDGYSDNAFSGVSSINIRLKIPLRRGESVLRVRGTLKHDTTSNQSVGFYVQTKDATDELASWSTLKTIGSQTLTSGVPRVAVDLTTTDYTRIPDKVKSCLLIQVAALTTGTNYRISDMVIDVVS